MPRRREIEGEKEVDLAALVDVMSNMLFFLLATVSFLQLKTLNAAVPIASNAAVSTGKSVDVSVSITDTGYILDAHGESSDTKVGRVDVHQEIPRVGKDLNAKELTKQLWEVKKKAPENKNIIIQAELTIPFQDVITTMDASREMPSIVDPKKKVPLFSRPVLSRAVTDEDLTPPGGAPPGGAPPAPTP
jgi:biopolymer transport protein ExbD